MGFTKYVEIKWQQYNKQKERKETEEYLLFHTLSKCSWFLRSQNFKLQNKPKQIFKNENKKYIFYIFKNRN